MKAYFDKIYRGKYSEFISELKENILTEKKRFVITANPETFMLGDGNPVFDAILKGKHTTIVPDGIGIVKAANMLGIPLESRITGVEICQELLKILDEEKEVFFCLEPKKKLEKRCAERFQKIILE